MKLIINIDKKEYHKIYTMVHDNLMEFLGVPNSVDVAIANGIPLPKGHGRLIDADKLLEEYGKYDIGFVVDRQPTVIEADKENEE